MTPRRLLDRAAANARSLLALASLAAVAGGCWMAWPPLGLIIPGLIVFGALTWTHLTERKPGTDPEEAGRA